MLLMISFIWLYEKVHKYNIQPTDMHNFDEKGCLIGLSRSTKRVISIDALKSKGTTSASQDGSREFITLIAAICAAGPSVPPALIYQGASSDLQDTWLDESKLSLLHCTILSTFLTPPLPNFHRLNLKSSAMRMKAYEKQSFMKRRNENVEKS
jgi:hypothetical protein